MERLLFRLGDSDERHGSHVQDIEVEGEVVARVHYSFVYDSPPRVERLAPVQATDAEIVEGMWRSLAPYVADAGLRESLIGAPIGVSEVWRDWEAESSLTYFMVVYRLRTSGRVVAHVAVPRDLAMAPRVYLMGAAT